MSKESIDYREKNYAVLSREAAEKHTEKSKIFDSNGALLCEVLVSHMTKRIIQINCPKYVNTNNTAENNDEIIFNTNSKGSFKKNKIDRKTARENNERYLVVTSLIFHNGKKLLVQKRSKNKSIDPGLDSASAHGVAKQLFFSDRNPMQSVENSALINSALEINEELRHNADPFTIKIWDSNEEALNIYQETLQINDPNTIFLIPTALYENDGYPLKTNANSRTRAISSGYIFSKKTPQIHIDPNELENARWENFRETVRNHENNTEDLNICLTQFQEELILRNRERVSGILTRNLI